MGQIAAPHDQLTESQPIKGKRSQQAHIDQQAQVPIMDFMMVDAEQETLARTDTKREPLIDVADGPFKFDMRPAFPVRHAFRGAEKPLSQKAVINNIHISNQ